MPVDFQFGHTSSSKRDFPVGAAVKKASTSHQPSSDKGAFVLAIVFTVGAMLRDEGC